MKQKRIPKFCNNAMKLSTVSFLQQQNLCLTEATGLSTRGHPTKPQVLSFYQKFQSPERHGCG